MHQWIRPVFVCLVGGLVIHVLNEGDFDDSSDGKMAKTYSLDDPIVFNYSEETPQHDGVNCFKGQEETSWPQEIRLWGEVRTLCDTTTDGGGWVTIQRRSNGDTSFYRLWEEYKYGFGNLYMGFWIGNENIHRLTSKGFNELRIDLMYKGKPYFAQYTSFSVASEELNYTLSVSGYSGTAGDSLALHNNMKFSTPDRDNDIAEDRKCASYYTSGWWYRHCYNANLNGVWMGLGWQDLLWETLPNATEGVRFSEMKVRRV